MTDERQLTEAELVARDEWETQYHLDDSTARQWMRFHARDYTPSKKNADILKNWILLHRANEKMSFEMLECAWEATKHLMETVKEDVKPVEIQKEALPAWGKLKSRRNVDAIPKAQYREWLKNPLFVADVETAVQRKTQ
jgi:hypothetical protein